MSRKSAWSVVASFLVGVVGSWFFFEHDNLRNPAVTKPKEKISITSPALNIRLPSAKPVIFNLEAPQKKPLVSTELAASVAAQWQTVMQIGMIRPKFHLGGTYDRIPIEASHAVCGNMKIYPLEFLSAELPSDQDVFKTYGLGLLLQSGARFKFEDNSNYAGEVRCIFIKVPNFEDVQIVNVREDVRRVLCKDADKKLLKSTIPLDDVESIVRCIRVDRPRSLPTYKLIIHKGGKCFAMYPTVLENRVYGEVPIEGVFNPRFNEKSYCDFTLNGKFIGDENRMAHEGSDQVVSQLIFKIKEEQFELLSISQEMGFKLELIHHGDGQVIIEEQFIPIEDKRYYQIR